MKEKVSTRAAAQELGVTILTLQRHISAKTIAAPPLLTVGTVKVRLWSDRDIEKARKVLASTKPGRKKKTSPSKVKTYEEWIATADSATLAAARKAFGEDLRPFYKKFRKEHQQAKKTR